MRPAALFLGLVAALLAQPAFAQVDRYLVEDGDGGTLTRSAAPNYLKGQDATGKGVGWRCAANSCTRPVPTTATAPSEGLLISGVGSYFVTAELDGTTTFSGGGTLEIWLLADDSNSATGPAATWYYVIGKDIVPTSGKQFVMSTVQLTSLRPGKYRLVVRPNAVTTSTATPILTTSVRACQSKACAP